MIWEYIKYKIKGPDHRKAERRVIERRKQDRRVAAIHKKLRKSVGVKK